MGDLHDISIRNMDNQHDTDEPVAVLAFADGDGMVKALTSLGAEVILTPGAADRTASEIARRFDSLAASDIVVLPNNAALLSTARKAATKSAKNVEIVPTVTEAAGVVALMARLYGADFQTNIAAMNEAMANLVVVVIEKDNDYAVRVGDDIVAQSMALQGLIEAVVAVVPFSAALATLYPGSDANPEMTAELVSAVARTTNIDDVEVVAGGQSESLYQLVFE